MCVHVHVCDIASWLHCTWALPHLHDSQMGMCVGVPKVTVGPHIHTFTHSHIHTFTHSHIHMHTAD